MTWQPWLIRLCNKQCMITFACEWSIWPLWLVSVNKILVCLSIYYLMHASAEIYVENCKKKKKKLYPVYLFDVRYYLNKMWQTNWSFTRVFNSTKRLYLISYVLLDKYFVFITCYVSYNKFMVNWHHNHVMTHFQIQLLKSFLTSPYSDSE